MSMIEVKLFQTPMVYRNHGLIRFPYRKAEALFYYLLVEGQASREELMNLFWGELDEESARKNLRNTMYKIRRTFQMEIIISPQKSIVKLNPDIDIHSELPLLKEKNPGELSWYRGEFLQGFSLKDSEPFEEWLRVMRTHYQDQYTSQLFQSIDKALGLKNITRAETLAKELIKLEPYDERAYQRLFKIYQIQKNYPKAIALYRNLEEVLSRELGITPAHETKVLFDKLIELHNLQVTKEAAAPYQDFFYGRERELESIQSCYQPLIEGNGVGGLLIIGEAGIGKTKLKDRFLKGINPDEGYLFHATCYQAEEDYLLKPWNPIISRVAEILQQESIEIPALWQRLITEAFPLFSGVDTTRETRLLQGRDSLRLQTAEEAISKLFKEMSHKRKILLVFDDLQWMDATSLNLLCRILLSNRTHPIMLLATCRNEKDTKIDGFISRLAKELPLKKMELKRFSRGEVSQFLQQALPHRRISEDLASQIYQETEGNTFFLTEYINALKEHRNTREMSSKIKDIVKGRFLGISEEGRKLLNVISLFFDRVSLELLKAITEREELALLELLEELQNKYIIKELMENNKIYYQFTHQKLREFVYFELSRAKKRLLHNRVGLLLEKQLSHDKRDIHLYSKLIYHFSSGGNLLATVKYRIKNIDAYLAFTHELYPVLLEYDIPEKSLYLNREEALKHLYEIERLLQDLMEYNTQGNEGTNLQILFLHMKGRFLIREGEYEQGVDYIHKMIDLAEGIRDHGAALKGYRQLIYYGIQAHDILLMEQYIKKGLELAKEQGLMGEQGILLRLKGLSKLLSSHYEEAEEILSAALDAFKTLSPQEDQYALNIAAVYNYLGEVHRHRMAFANALYYYDQAMQICEKKKITRGLTIFNTNAGKTAFDMGDDIRAEEYLQRALEIYQQFDVLWGRAIAEGYTALLLIRKGDYQGGLGSLMRADEYSQKLKNPYERGIVCRIKAEIKGQVEHSQSLREIIQPYLPKSIEDYCDEGIAYLKEVKEYYEINTLRVLKRTGK